MTLLHDPLEPRSTGLAAAIARHADGTRTPTAIGGLTLLRADASTPIPVQTVYTPTVCVIAQGRKQVRLADQRFDYDAASYLVGSVHLPVTGLIVEATPDRPYLAVSLALDPDELAGLLPDAREATVDTAGDAANNVARGLGVSALDDALLDAFTRLVRLLDRPADIAVMAPLIRREIFYRLLTGPQSAMLRQLGVRDGRTRQVARVVTWLREHYASPFSMDELVAIANVGG
jgi:AraC-type transcriptional regulator N-terminus